MGGSHDSIGQRVAYYRRRQGKTQEALGGLVGRSAEWVRKIENGRLPLDSLSMIYLLSRVLRVPLVDLIGERAAYPNPDNSAGTESLRNVLTTFDFFLSPAAADIRVRPISEIQADLERGWRRWYDAHYQDTGELCAALIHEIELSASQQSGDEQRRLWAALADAYQLAVGVLRKSPDYELAHLASDRAVFAGKRSEEPTVLMWAVFRSSSMHLSAGRPEVALSLATTAMDRVRTELAGAEFDAERPVLLGALALRGAMSAARQNDTGGTWELLREADLHAQALPPGSPPHIRTWFTPTNVAMHRVHGAVELGRPREALELGAEVQLDRMPPERQGRYLIDVARAHDMRRNTDGVVLNLLDAERVAPEDIRTAPLVKQTVANSLRRQRGRRNYRLIALAERTGVTG